MAEEVFCPVGQRFQERYGLSKTDQRALINAGELRSVLMGRRSGRRFIEVASFREYVERQRQREVSGELRTGSPNPKAPNAKRGARRVEPAAAGAE